MNPKREILLAAWALLLAGCDAGNSGGPGEVATGGNEASNPVDVAVPVALSVTELGGQLFSDVSLSATGSQSCASCHTATAGFADPDHLLPVSEGAMGGLFGTRNAPTASYSARIPAFALTPPPSDAPPGATNRWTGGLFLDGRADSLEAQAAAPFFNPAEMNLTDAADLVAQLRASAVRASFESIYGADSLGEGADPAQVLTQVTSAIAAFERSAALMPYSSKFDAVQAGAAVFTSQEALGFAVFTAPDKGRCAACHDPQPAVDGTPPVFSDFSYINLGVPRNPDRSFYTADFVDPGLETTLLANGQPADRAAQFRGHFRVPTLRNVALTAPYMHNGVFADLRTVVEFYNTRDSDPARWAAIGAPEVPDTVGAIVDVGNLGLSAAEVDALVAFLATLSDGYPAI